MKRKIALFMVMALAAIMAAYSAGHAATRTAASCSQQDVQSAIDWASSGDSVLVPAGNCTWNTGISIPSSSKIKMQGAGIGSTVITAASYGSLISMNQSGSRVTGFELVNGYILTDGVGWRVDHCEIRNTSFKEGVYVRGNMESIHPGGLIDHCTFRNTRVNVYGWAGLLAHAIWSQSINLGSVYNTVYVEDCTFTSTDFTNAIDSNYGGRYVFRYNILNDTYVEAHSLQGNDRASQKWEIYNNTFNQVSRSMWVPMFLRGGTGVVFNNTLTGNWELAGIALDNVRSCNVVTDSGKCNGTSPWDGNQAGGNGYPCRDQIGRSNDQYLWTLPRPYPPQLLDPAYAWNNKYGGSDVLFFQHGCDESKAHIRPNRDYFNNIPKPGYKPYTYPHPLVQGWNPTSVAPPSNLHIVDTRP
jgi:hypothetical protein